MLALYSNLIRSCLLIEIKSTSLYLVNKRASPLHNYVLKIVSLTLIMDRNSLYPSNIQPPDPSFIDNEEFSFFLNGAES